MDPTGPALTLPKQVVAAALARIPDVAHQIRDIGLPLWELRDPLREHLLEAGMVRQVDRDTVLGTDVCAVDGGTATESAYLGDLSVTLAFAASGRWSTVSVDEPDFAHSWMSFQPHRPDADRLAKAVMMGGEVKVAAHAAASHDLVLLDGSFQTPVLAITSILSSQNPSVRADAVTELENLGVTDAFATVLSHNGPGKHVVACPKSDTEQRLIPWILGTAQVDLPNDLSTQLGKVAGLPDKVIAALLLEPGEMFLPMPTPNRWSEVRVRAADGDTAAGQLATRLDQYVEPIRAKESEPDRGISVTYAMPDNGINAIKVETKRKLGADHAEKVVATLFRDSFQPHMLEPYPQYVADDWAKSVAPVLSAVHSGSLNMLAAGTLTDADGNPLPKVDPRWLHLAAMSHRTAR